MGDASLGGKNGVNLNSLKNQIGVFKHPIFILIDLNFLNTLPKLEIRNGFSEMIKHGLIHNKNHWNKLYKINNTFCIINFVHSIETTFAFSTCISSIN